MIFSLTEQDFVAIKTAKDSGYLDEWNESMLKSAVKNGNFYGFKATSDEEILGYVHYSTCVDSMDINSVFVFPKFRKNGLGEKLLNAVISVAKEKNIDKIFLEVRKSNFSAINLYEKVGFIKISERKKYYPNGEDAVIMIKEILL